MSIGLRQPTPGRRMTDPCLRCTKPIGFHGSRGLCYACYRTMRVAVLSGRITWQRVVAAGFALPLPGGSN